MGSQVLDPLFRPSQRATCRQVYLDEDLLAQHLNGKAKLDCSRFIFLDIDGVLHPDVALPQEAFQGVTHLARALKEAQAMDHPIVVCSDWRLDTPLDELRRTIAALDQSLARLIVGVTADLLDMGGSRGAEVSSWMDWARNIPGFGAHDASLIAIDDRPHWYGEHHERVFKVNGRTGLCEAQAANLVSWMRAGRQDPQPGSLAKITKWMGP